MLKETNDGIIATIRISPNAKKNEIIRDGEFTKIKITALPIDGKANKALVEFCLRILKFQTSIKILKGETSKDKTILFMTKNVEKLKILKETL